MSGQRLGPRKIRRIERATGLWIVKAVVWSHVECGRWAWLTLADGRTASFDRHTGQIHRT